MMTLLTMHACHVHVSLCCRVDWCCVPQYSGGTMVEVLRSKLFYARARIMVVLPTFHELPKVGSSAVCISTQGVCSRVRFCCVMVVLPTFYELPKVRVWVWVRGATGVYTPSIMALLPSSGHKHCRWCNRRALVAAVAHTSGSLLGPPLLAHSGR